MREDEDKEQKKVPLAVLVAPSWMTASPTGKSQVSDRVLAKEREEASVDVQSRRNDTCDRYMPSWFYTHEALLKKSDNGTNFRGHSRSDSADSVCTQPAV